MTQETIAKKEPAVIERKLEGVVVSAKMAKTIVVEVERVKVHPKYHKRFTVSRHYKVHDEENKFKEGDKVRFMACRPISRDKRWRVIYNQEVEK